MQREIVARANNKTTRHVALTALRTVNIAWRSSILYIQFGSGLGCSLLGMSLWLVGVLFWLVFVRVCCVCGRGLGFDVLDP